MQTWSDLPGGDAKVCIWGQSLLSLIVTDCLVSFLATDYRQCCAVLLFQCVTGSWSLRRAASH